MARSADEQWREMVAELAPHVGPAMTEPAPSGDWSGAWRRRLRIPSGGRSARPTA